MKPIAPEDQGKQGSQMATTNAMGTTNAMATTAMTATHAEETLVSRMKDEPSRSVRCHQASQVLGWGFGEGLLAVLLLW